MISLTVRPLFLVILFSVSGRPFPTVPGNFPAVANAFPTAPRELSAAPREPFAAPRELSAAPRELSAAPREPSAAPRELSAAPREPFAAPREPSAAPREPSAAPREPSAAPREPSAATAQEAAALDQQAVTLEGEGKYAEALPLAQRAFDARQTLFGAHHLDTAASFYTLAMLHEDQGDLPAAVASYEQTLKIREDLLGPEHAEVAQTLNAMGNTLFQQGQLSRAETVWRRALAIREKTAGPDAMETAKTVNNLAALRQTQGDVAGAVDYYQRALAIFEKQLGPDHPITANTLNNLGVIHHDLLGDLPTAETYLRRALASWEKALGSDHPRVGTSLTNLASVLVDRGDFSRAVEMSRRALAIYEKSNGPTHPETIRARNDLAAVLMRAGQLDEAEKLDRDAIGINEKALGANSPLVASPLMNLAELYRRKNQPALAEPLAARAEAIYRQAFGPEHPDTALALAAHAGSLLDLGRRDEAAALAVQLARAEEAALGNVLSFTTEAQRMTFQSTHKDAYSLLATLGAAAPLEEAVLRTKGAILDSLLEDHLVALASADPARQQGLDDARAMRRELTGLQLDAPEDASPEALKKRDARKRELAAKLDAAESGMARTVAGVGRARRALGVTTAEVRAALPAGGVLVDFVRYAHDLGHDLATEDRYGAVVLARDVAPKWVPLGPAAKLDELLRLYHEAVRGKAADPLALEEELGGLYRAVWGPLETSLAADATQVFISPDGELNFLSFATLLAPDDRFLAERHSITYLASGRDVLTTDAAPPDRADRAKTLLVFADPQRKTPAPAAPAAPELAGTAAGTGASGPRLAYRDLRLGPLPGAESEAKALARFADARRWKNETLVGADATERRLRSVHRPYILHLATHGFFLPAPGTAANGVAGNTPSAQWLNPMRRSGLALTGADATLDAWAAGRTPATEDDGIVTAEEVSTLDLHGTWLAVLSACESGGGEVRAGEGVLGLRRGFTLAGARHLLLTLWPVGDEETSRLILDFYARADKSGDPARALAETQRDHLVRLRRDQGLNAAVRLAGGFILSSAHQ